MERLRYPAASLALSIALSGGTPLRAQAVKLNGALAREIDSEVIDYRISPDAARVVLRADTPTDGVYELYSALADGSSPVVRLNDPLPPGASVGGSVINVFGAGGGWDYDVASSGRVVFIADLAVDDMDELYTVPANGSASPTRLNGTLAPVGDVQRFWILPGEQYVLYLAYQADQVGLFRVPVDGSAAPVSITPGILPRSVWLAPDGSAAAFTILFGSPARERLFAVPTDGSAPPVHLAVTQVPPAGGATFVESLDISADGAWAVFREVLDEEGLVDADVFAVPMDGSQVPTQLNQTPHFPFWPYRFDGVGRVFLRDPSDLFTVALDGGQRVDLTPAGWSAADTPVQLTDDGTTVVFEVRNVGLGALYRAPVDGSQPATLVVAPGARIAGFALAGTQVVYSTTTAPSDFLVVPLDGGPSLALNPAPFDEGARDFRVHPGGQDLLFRAQADGGGVEQLYTVPLDASALPRRLNGNLIPTGDVESYTLSAAGALVVYRADQFVNEALELFGVPFAGGPVERYNPPLAAGPVLGDVQSFTVSPDGERTLYLADEDEDGVERLHLARTDGRGRAHDLAASLDEANAAFSGAAFTPDGTRVVFLLSAVPSSASGDLYSVAVDQSSPPLRIDDRPRVYAQSLAVDAQGTRVVYRRQRTLFGTFYELCSAPLTESGLALALTPPTGNVSEFQLVPGGGAAIYLADHAVAGVVELHRVPLDGSAPAVRLHPALPASADVTSFALTPDGLHVVYLADVDVDQRFEVHVVPSDGSAPPVKRNGALVAGGNVTHFALAPDGLSVVYRADERVDQTFELFAFPLAGGPAAVVAPLPSGRLVQTDFAVSADGETVVYRANPADAAVVQLLRAPGDGSASPSVLSAPLVAGGDVLAFALAPDGSRVVYRADQRLDNVHELHSVPLAGGPVALLQALSASADVSDFRIAPDSATVAWRADARADEVHELFAAPLDGSAPARRVCQPMATGGDVQTDFAPLSNGRVVHRADQGTDGVFELFTGFLAHGPRRSGTPTRTAVR